MTVDGQKACSRCGRPRDRKGQRYCKRCHAQYQRDRRAGMIEVLLTLQEWEDVKQRRAAGG
jgi:predicted amidophosphoribosyltransferase